MTEWDELQPRFRDAVLAERRSGRTTTDIADELHAGRSTVFRMLANDGVPRPAVQIQAEQFVERRQSRLGRSAEDQPEE